MKKIDYYISDISDGNLWLHIWDDEKKVINNRKKLAWKLWFELDDFVFMNQIHSWILKSVWAEDKWKWTLDYKQTFECDALVSSNKWIVIWILVADCVPIILYDEVGEVVAVVHSWWKWTSEKIVSNTIEEMKKKGSDTQNIKVVIWPSIWVKNYEVWIDVAKKFREEVRIRKSEQKELLNLKAENFLQAIESWIKINNISDMEVDTFTNKKYFSARRDWFSGGRFGAFIWIKK